MRQMLIFWMMIFVVVQFSSCQTTAKQSQNSSSDSKEENQTDDNNSFVSEEISLIGTKWILVELHGNAVIKDSKSKEAPFLLFNDDFKASAYAGCNRLFAKYELREGKHIQFKNFASTRMACLDMKTEQVLMQVLQTVDTYSFKGKKMMLSKYKTAPLAVFVAEK